MTTKFDVEKFAQTADRIRQRAIEENRLLDNPSDEQLRTLVEKQPGVMGILLLKANLPPGHRALPRIVLMTPLIRRNWNY